MGDAHPVTLFTALHLALDFVALGTPGTGRDILTKALGWADQARDPDIPGYGWAEHHRDEIYQILPRAD